LRETVVFAEHNLLSDAPFSRLDMVTCRNVLIYLDPKVQGAVIDMFHFALNKNGILVLGTSETLSNDDSGFEAVSREHRVYRHGRESLLMWNRWRAVTRLCCW
jgi:two-component system CheB/CheR fusion protein